MPLHHAQEPAHLSALLGPTNTGKTWRAVSRMLAHESGVIGFPLRLLARENYERLVAEKGATQVALITGEEKIIPPAARWFCCTVEAMPLSRRFAFVAIDEIQLCADPDRGHIFTDRILHCRGTMETLLLGSDTMRRVLRQLFPGIQIELRPRLSELHYAGHAPYAKLPPRAAIVAFSASEVYAIADMLRRRRGGCAIVMGQLSPRTRNAQVALFQNREVDYIVATDAIGMGLNMDVDHVALAARDKFDGARFRGLSLLEMAQIFGRAGRGLQDGTFGTTGTAQPLDVNAVQNIEAHQFPPIEHLIWRNADLDFSSPEQLYRSLEAPAQHRAMRRGREATDIATLKSLLRSDEALKLASSPARTALLWEVCQIPDFKKLGDTSHDQLCERLFLSIARDGHVSQDWFLAQIARLNVIEGDIETLMHRLTAIRICTYVASKTDWSPQGASWAAQTRAVEDALSDALHEKLKARYIDRAAFSLSRHLKAQTSEAILSSIIDGHRLVVEGHQVGKLEGLSFTLDADLTTSARALALKAGQRAVKQHLPHRVQHITSSAVSAFSVDPLMRTISWNGEVLSRFIRGRSALKPELLLIANELEAGPLRQRVEMHLKTVVETILRQTFAPLYKVIDQVPATPVARGLQHQLIEYIGVVKLNEQRGQSKPVSRAPDRLPGVTYGSKSVYVRGLLGQKSGDLRLMLLSNFYGWKTASLDYARVSMRSDDVTRPADVLNGWVHSGPVMVRLDIAESWLKKLTLMTRKKTVPLPMDMASALGVRREDVSRVLQAWRIQYYEPLPLDKSVYGPQCPTLLLSSDPKTRKKAQNKKQARGSMLSRYEGAFAALKAWRAK